MWMYTLLPKIWNMSLTASMVIAVVLLARLLLRRAPRKFSYALWAVVLFRLLCPFSFSAPFSLLSAADVPVTSAGTIEYIPPEIVHMESPAVELPSRLANQYINSTLPQGEEQLAADPMEAPMALMTAVWLTGAAAMTLYSIFSLIQLRRKLVGAVQLRDNIFLADGIPSPFVMGLLRPKIYLPSTLSQRERDYIILHEQTHIRRLDHLSKALAFLALTVHWFNPLVWLAFVLSGEDMEMSCDEAVMAETRGDVRADYSASLLSLSTGRRIIAGAPLAFGEGDAGKRIRNVLRYQKPAVWAAVLAALLLAALVLALAANPKSKDTQSLWGAVYQIQETLYSTPQDSLSDTSEAYPQYCVTADHGLMRRGVNEDSWQDMGGLYEVKMSHQELYTLFEEPDAGVRNRLENVKTVYRADAGDGSGLFHLVMVTRSGDRLIAMGLETAEGAGERIRSLFEVLPLSGGFMTNCFDLSIGRALGYAAEGINVESFSIYETERAPRCILVGWYAGEDIGYSVFRYERDAEHNFYELLPGGAVFVGGMDAEPSIFLTECQLENIAFDIVLSADPGLERIERTAETDTASAVQHTPVMEVFERQKYWDGPVYWRFSGPNGEPLLEGDSEELLCFGNTAESMFLDEISEMAGTTAVEIFSVQAMETAPYYIFAGWQTQEQIGFSAFLKETVDGKESYRSRWGSAQPRDSGFDTCGFSWDRRGGIFEGMEMTFDILLSVNPQLARIERTVNGAAQSIEFSSSPALAVFPMDSGWKGEVRNVMYDKNGQVIGEFIYGDADVLDASEEPARPYLTVHTSISVFASWYPEGFDFDYEALAPISVGTEYQGVALSFSEPEVTELDIGVDFYDGSFIKKLEYTLSADGDGSFILPLPEEAAPGDSLICFVPYGDSGKFVFKIEIM